MRRADERLEEFARRVNQIAQDDERATGRRVLIAHVWDALDYPHRQEFERDMLAANRAGLIELQRIDMPRFFDEEDMEVSLIEHPMTGAQYHAVVAPTRQNPSNGVDDDGDLDAVIADGLERFEKFHQLEPNEVVADDEQAMPTKAHCLGKAIHVMYRSGKVDPETGKKPRRPQNYIHEHDAGVMLYEPCLHALRKCSAEKVPSDVRSEKDGDTTLVLLGECLGLAYKATEDGEDYEIEFDDPKVELYCIPSGKALVIVEGKREILYLVWGGGLGVEPRGIIG